MGLQHLMLLGWLSVPCLGRGQGEPLENARTSEPRQFNAQRSTLDTGRAADEASGGAVAKADPADEPAFRLSRSGGKLRLIHPDGQPFIALGVNHIGAVAGDRAFFAQRYAGDWNQFLAHLHEQFECWNMNCVGYGAPKAIQQHFPYFATITLANIEFLEVIADRFYSVVGSAQRKHDPRHLVFVVDPPAGSLNRLLDRAGIGAAVVDLRELAPDSDLGRWMAQERAILGVGDLFLGSEKIPEYHYGGDRVLSPAAAFDAIVYLPDTHATAALER